VHRALRRRRRNGEPRRRALHGRATAMHAACARTARRWPGEDATMSLRAWMAARLATARRHSVRVWLLWAVGTVVVLAVSFALADPGLVVLAFDPELIALIVLSSIALIRISAPGLFLSGCAASLTRSTRRRERPRGSEHAAVGVERSDLEGLVT